MPPVLHLHKYEVFACDDVERLIKKKRVTIRPPNVLSNYIRHLWHYLQGPPCHRWSWQDVETSSLQYANITNEALELFMAYCLVWQEKKKRPSNTGVVASTIMSLEFNSCGQVDLIYRQSAPQGQFKWIIVYRCQLTRFVLVRPLSCKRAPTIAFQLLYILLLFGIPAIVQSDNGSEFPVHVIRELKDLWPHLILDHGKHIHPLIQGSVERANSDIKGILIAWISENNIHD